MAETSRKSVRPAMGFPKHGTGGWTTSRAVYAFVGKRATAFVAKWKLSLVLVPRCVSAPWQFEVRPSFWLVSGSGEFPPVLVD